MRIILIFILSLVVTLLWMSYTYAESAKWERAGAVEHTPHPPHDHREPDHMKKLDEGMRSNRKKKV